MKRLYTLGLLASCAMLCAPDDALAAGNDALNSRIKAALSKLDTANNDDWTDAGLPRVERLREISGEQGLTRAMVADAAPGYNRANAHAAPSDTSTLTSKQQPVAQAGGDTPIPVQIVKANELGGEPDAGDFLKSPATLSKEAASDELTAGEAAANNTTSMYPEITAGAGGTPGNDDGPLIAEDSDDTVTVEPSDIAERYPDAFALLDAVAIVAAQDRYRRNGGLQQLVRSFAIQQVQLRDHQGRLDARDQAREARQDDDGAKVA